MSGLYNFLLRTVLIWESPSLADTPARGTTFCQQIDAKIPGRVAWAATAAYNSAQAQYYSGQEQDLKPACIFRPHDAFEVSQFVKGVVNAAQEGGNKDQGQPSDSTQFAIRGGGHSVFPGAANIDGGVTVDLRALNSVVLSDDGKIASVGGGSIWSEIYPQLEKNNLTVAGGRVAGVGVGGFLTGGGVSYLSRRHGWACDNVHGYEVVLGSGEIVYATADNEYHDLWLALKGGSNNFGIVTRFDLITYPQPTMWGGTILFEYSSSLLDVQAEAYSAFMDPSNFDDAATMFVAFFYLNGAWIGGNVLFYIEPVDNPPVFRNFTSIPEPIANTLRLTKVSDVATEQPSTRPPGANRAVDIVYSFENPSAAVYRELFQTWEDGTRALESIEGLELSLLIQPHAVSNGVNSLGLSPGAGKDVVLSVVTVAYSHKADDEVVQRGLEAIVDKHVEILKHAGVYIPFQYLNYADKESQNPIASYGADVKARLQAVSKKYDPAGIFQTKVPGGFKLFEQEGTEKATGIRDEL